MAVDGGTPVDRVTPASGSSTIRPVGGGKGRQGSAGREQEDAPHDTVELSEGNASSEAEAEVSHEGDEAPELKEEEHPRLDLQA